MYGKVVEVIDGNTVEVLIQGDRYRSVLLGIDCPEPGQPYSDEARDFLRGRLLGQEVEVVFHGKDRLKNYIAIILLRGGGDVRLELLEKGLAWTAEKDPIQELETHRRVAEAAKSGLWSTPNPTPPWVYRRQQSMVEPKSR